MGILRDMTWLHNFWCPLANLLHSILGFVFISWSLPLIHFLNNFFLCTCLFFMVKRRFISFEFLFSASIVFWLTISVIHAFDECALTSGFEGTDHCCVPKKKRKWKSRKKREGRQRETMATLEMIYSISIPSWSDVVVLKFPHCLLIM